MNNFSCQIAQPPQGPIRVEQIARCGMPCGVTSASSPEPRSEEDSGAEDVLTQHSTCCCRCLRMQQRCLDRALMSLPQSEALLEQWASGLAPSVEATERFEALVEALCQRFDAYWPDHRVFPQSTLLIPAGPSGGGSGEIDIFFLVPKQDPIGVVRMIHEHLRCHPSLLLDPQLLPYWPQSGSSNSTYVVQVSTREIDGYITVSSDRGNFESAELLAEATLSVLEGGNPRARQVSSFLRRWRHLSTGCEGALVAVSVLDAVAVQACQTSSPTTTFFGIICGALDLLQDTQGLKSLLKRQYERHDEYLWSSVAKIAKITKLFMVRAFSVKKT